MKMFGTLVKDASPLLFNLMSAIGLPLSEMDARTFFDIRYVPDYNMGFLKRKGGIFQETPVESSSGRNVDKWIKRGGGGEKDSGLGKSGIKKSTFQM